MERELSITITVENDGAASINILDESSSDNVSIEVSKDTNCNQADDLAKQIGYEILSWIDIERENLNEQ